MYFVKFRLILFLFALATVSCGGDGGSGGNGSGHVPYLLSQPTVSFVQNSVTPDRYDVTITLEADGPTGVMFVDLWLMHETDEMEFDHLDLVNTSGNTWTATTSSFSPLVAGQWVIDDITLEDSDVFSDPVTRSGWYITPILGGSNYILDEREVDNDTSEFLFYRAGTSNIPVKRFVLP